MFSVYPLTKLPAAKVIIKPLDFMAIIIAVSRCVESDLQFF